MKLVRGSEIEFVGASHENPKQPGVFKRVLATREQVLPGRVQMINWAKLPQGSRFQRHYHEDMQEAFIILNGEVTMRVEQADYRLAAGDMILIDPREEHTMWNESQEDVAYVVIGITLDQGGQTVVVEPTDA
ncbi:MAG: cupin domain-containing protein [Planctomycetota bacterium]